MDFWQRCQNNSKDKGWSSKTVVLGQVDIHMQTKLDYCITRFTKINWNWIIDLSVRAKVIKHSEHILVNLCDLGIGCVIKDTKAQVKKETIDWLNFIKIDNFCAANGNNQDSEGQTTEWENIFVNVISHSP